MRRASYARPLLALVLFFAASAASLAFLNRPMPAYGAYAPTPTADIAALCAARIAAGSDLQLNTYRGAPELFEHDGSDTCTLLDVPWASYTEYRKGSGTTTTLSAFMSESTLLAFRQGEQARCNGDAFTQEGVKKNADGRVTNCTFACACGGRARMESKARTLVMKEARFPNAAAAPPAPAVATERLRV